MGRPTKNAEHPLVRLRKALSTSTQQMTRTRFSKKVGIAESTIKGIESDTFKLSPKHAAQISSATNVSPKCLMDPGMPLVDILGAPIEEGKALFAANFDDQCEFEDLRVLFEAALEVAEEKNKHSVFSFLFQQWLEETSEILGLRSAITDKLLESYPLKCFGAISNRFWPRDQRKRRDVKEAVAKFESDVLVKAIMLRSLKVPEHLKTEFFEHMTTGFAEEVASLAKGTQGRHARYMIEGSSKANLKDSSKAYWDLRRKMIEEAKASKPV